MSAARRDLLQTLKPPTAFSHTTMTQYLKKSRETHEFSPSDHLPSTPHVMVLARSKFEVKTWPRLQLNVAWLSFL